MKVLFKNMINGYTGCMDDYVIYYNKQINRCVIRQRPFYKKHPAHPGFKAVMANLKVLNPSQGYRDDCAKYVKEYNELVANSKPHIVTWSNLYQKIMWMMKRIMPEIDLATLSREQIYAQELPCISVKKAVEAGLLARVKGYAELDNEM